MQTKGIADIQSNEKLTYGFNSSEINRFIDTLQIEPSDNLQNLKYPSTMNVGIAQILLRPYHSLADYIREMDFLVKQAVNQRAQVILFPQFTGFLPATLFPQYEKLRKTLQLDETSKFPSRLWIHQAVTAVASECYEIYSATMSALAQGYRIYIAAGSAIYPEKSNFVHRALLFGPDGTILGQQDKVIPSYLEQILNIEPANEIHHFHTEIGDFSLLIGTDTNSYEPTKIAHNLGSTTILNPNAFVAPYTGVTAAAGLNLRVQEQPLFGVQATLIGSTPFGFMLEGPSGVFAPLRFSLPNAKNGMYLRTIKQRQTQMLTVKLSPESLAQCNDPLLISHNQNFLTANIDKLY